MSLERDKSLREDFKAYKEHLTLTKTAPDGVTRLDHQITVLSLAESLSKHILANRLTAYDADDINNYGYGGSGEKRPTKEYLDPRIIKRLHKEHGTVGTDFFTQELKVARKMQQAQKKQHKKYLTIDRIASNQNLFNVAGGAASAAAAATTTAAQQEKPQTPETYDKMARNELLQIVTKLLTTSRSKGAAHSSKLSFCDASYEIGSGLMLTITSKNIFNPHKNNKIMENNLNKIYGQNSATLHIFDEHSQLFISQATVEKLASASKAATTPGQREGDVGGGGGGAAVNIVKADTVNVATKPEQQKHHNK